MENHDKHFLGGGFSERREGYTKHIFFLEWPKVCMCITFEQTPHHSIHLLQYIPDINHIYECNISFFEKDTSP
jgi:hypothetical protein